MRDCFNKDLIKDNSKCDHPDAGKFVSSEDGQNMCPRNDSAITKADYDE